MNKLGSAIGVVTVLLIVASQAKAYDPLNTDEKQTNLEARIKVAQTSGELKSRDVKELNIAMRELQEKKKKLKALHIGVLTADDDEALDKDMNIINSKLDELMAKNKGK